MSRFYKDFKNNNESHCSRVEEELNNNDDELLRFLDEFCKALQQSDFSSAISFMIPIESHISFEQLSKKSLLPILNFSIEIQTLYRESLTNAKIFIHSFFINDDI